MSGKLGHLAGHRELGFLLHPPRQMASLPALEITGACSQEHIVGMPVQAEDSGADGLFDVFAHPPRQWVRKASR